MLTTRRFGLVGHAVHDARSLLDERAAPIWLGERVGLAWQVRPVRLLRIMRVGLIGRTANR
jgi:hypothetical protein